MKRTEDQAKALARWHVEGKLSKVGADQLGTLTDLFTDANESLLTAHEHLFGQIDADDAMFVATQRHKQSSRTAAQLDDWLRGVRTLLIDGRHIRRELPTDVPVVLDLPALAAGEYAFHCGMKMIRGALVVQPAT